MTSLASRRAPKKRAGKPGIGPARPGGAHPAREHPGISGTSRKTGPCRTSSPAVTGEVAVPALGLGATEATGVSARGAPASRDTASRDTASGAPASRDTASSGTASSGTGRAAGLDGVRALAVLAVLAFHEGMGAARGGFLGVDIFFVLSGFLITDLLVSRQKRYGRLGLAGFWGRRARRLLPALAVVLVTVAAAVAVMEPAQLAALRPVLMAAVTYSSNWYQALHHVSYFATFGPPPPLQHLWSLAIEEQFYLFWPLILAVLLTRIGRPRTRALIAWLGAAASALAMVFLYTPGSDPSRVYYGTDTHATALLIGCAIALTWPLARLTAASSAVTARLDRLGLAGLAVLAWAVGHFSGADPVVYPGGLIIAALAAACLIAAAAAPGMIAAALSVGPLRWIGVRSYGIYLWHWPVIALAAAIVWPRPVTPWLWPAEAVLAIALAAASWRWIESPILRDGFRASCRAAYRVLSDSVMAARRSPVRALPAVIAAAALSVACTAGYGVIHPPATPGLQQQVAAGARVSAASRVPHPQPAGRPDPARAVSQPGPPSPASPAIAAGRGVSRPKIRGSQVTAIGDSVMLASALQLDRALPGIYIDAKVSRQMSAALSVVQALAGSGQLRPVVVVGLGTNGTVTTWQVRDLIRLIGPQRKLVLINTYEARPWEHEVNSVLAAAARNHSSVVVLADWLRAIQHRTGLLWSDGVHPRPAGARLYARVVRAAVQATSQSPAAPAPMVGRRLPNQVPQGWHG
jgi:peptidoglycan/LPS O-acetylase OafA/YrhL